MGSFTSLNSYGGSNVVSTISTTLFLDEGDDFQLPMPSWYFVNEIGILTGNGVTITHNLGPVANAAIAFGNIFAVTFPNANSSPNVSISRVGNTWTISNVKSAEDYLAIDGTVDIPPDLAGNITYTTVVTNTNVPSIPQTINVNLIITDRPEVTNTDLSDLVIPFGANVSYGGPYLTLSGTQLSNFSPLENQPGIYTVTITTQDNYANLILSTTSANALTTNSWTGTTTQGVLTLSGTKANVNAHLNTLRVSGNGSLDLWFNKQMTWRFINPSGYTTTLTQKYVQFHYSQWYLSGMTGNTTTHPSGAIIWSNFVGNVSEVTNSSAYYDWPLPGTSTTIPLRLRDALHVADDLSASASLGPIKLIGIGNAVINNNIVSFTKVDVEGAGNSYATYQMASGNVYTQNFSRYSIDSATTTLPKVGSFANTANTWHPAPYSPFTLNTQARLENGANIGSVNISSLIGDLSNKSLQWQYDKIVSGSDSSVIYSDTGSAGNYQRNARFVYQTQTSQYLNYNQLKITVDRFASAGNTFGWTNTGGYYGTWPIGPIPPSGSGLNDVTLQLNLSPVTFQPAKTWGGTNRTFADSNDLSMTFRLLSPYYTPSPTFYTIPGPFFAYSVIVYRYNATRDASASPFSNYVPSPYWMPFTSDGDQLVYGLYRSSYTTPYKADGTVGTTSWSSYSNKPQFFYLLNRTATRTRQGTITMTFSLTNPVTGAVPVQNSSWTTSGSITKTFTIYY